MDVPRVIKTANGVAGKHPNFDYRLPVADVNDRMSIHNRRDACELTIKVKKELFSFSRTPVHHSGFQLESHERQFQQFSG